MKVFHYGPPESGCEALGKEVYLAEIDHQWAEKAVSGLKDERLTPPYIGRLVRSLAAVYGYSMSTTIEPSNPVTVRTIPGLKLGMSCMKMSRPANVKTMR